MKILILNLSGGRKGCVFPNKINLKKFKKLFPENDKLIDDYEIDYNCMIQTRATDFDDTLHLYIANMPRIALYTTPRDVIKLVNNITELDPQKAFVEFDVALDVIANELQGIDAILANSANYNKVLNNDKEFIEMIRDRYNVDFNNMFCSAEIDLD